MRRMPSSISYRPDRRKRSVQMLLRKEVVDEGPSKVSIIESKEASGNKRFKDPLIEGEGDAGEKLPDAVPEEPITVPTEPEDAAHPTDHADQQTEGEEDANALYALLSGALGRKMDEIDEVKSLIATFGYYGEDRFGDVIKILNGMLDDDTIHLGMYQKSLELLNPDMQDRMEAGKDKAEEIIGEEPKE